MSKLSKEDILKLAQLSRIQLTETEIESLTEDVSATLEYVAQLQDVDLDGLEPTYQVTGLKDVTRPDEVKNYGPTPEQLLQNAPAVEDGHIKVKRMVG